MPQVARQLLNQIGLQLSDLLELSFFVAFGRAGVRGCNPNSETAQCGGRDNSLADFPASDRSAAHREDHH